MKCYYDFHIHTALSPCANNEMTPNNIINMVKLKGLDTIAITDHNSIKNVMPIMKLGKQKGITVIPGMEVQTAEEVHILCLFSCVKSAKRVYNLVYENLPNIKNREDIFGEQLIFDENDNIIAKENKLLLNSTNLSLNQLYDEVVKVNGAFIPAHIDRNSYSVLSNLGFIPNNLNIKTVEITKNAPIGLKEEYNKYFNIINSDAHNLGDILEPEFFMEISHNNVNKILKFLCKIM